MKDSEKIEAVCPHCSSATAEVISETSRDGSPLVVVLCQECGLARVNPLPDAAELAAFYRENYRLLYKGVYRPKPYHVLRNARVAVDRIQCLHDMLAPRLDVLDAGCGGGEFLYLLRAMGCRVTGIEPNLGYGNYAQKELGLDVHVGLIGDQPFADASFDRITLFHVLEHLPAPVETLARLGAWLRPEGLLAVEVPNLASACEHPAHRFHQAHLFYFTPATLEACGALAGLRVMRSEFSRYGGNVLTIFQRGEPEEKPRPVAYSQRSAWRYWLSPATYSRAFRRIGRMIGERLEARHYPTRRAVLDAVAGTLNTKHA